MTPRLGPVHLQARDLHHARGGTGGFEALHKSEWFRERWTADAVQQMLARRQAAGLS